MREEEKEIKEFRKKFEMEDAMVFKKNKDGTAGTIATLRPIENFIKKLLTSQRAELLEKVEKQKTAIIIQNTKTGESRVSEAVELSEVKKIIGGSDE